MGIIKKLLKRDLTPEEQERKSRQEQEWMQKCYDRGYRLAEKFSMSRMVARINDFGNKYPKSFFTIVFLLLGLSITGNYVLSGVIERMSQPSVKSAAEAFTLPSAEIIDEGRAPIAKAVQAVADSLHAIDGQIDSVLAKGQLTREDTLYMQQLLKEAYRLAEIISPQDAEKLIQKP